MHGRMCVRRELTETNRAGIRGGASWRGRRVTAEQPGWRRGHRGGGGSRQVRQARKPHYRGLYWSKGSGQTFIRINLWGPEVLGAGTADETLGLTLQRRYSSTEIGSSKSSEMYTDMAWIKP